MVQSLQLINRTEFYRLVAEVADGPAPVPVGSPLLSAREDYHEFVTALAPSLSSDDDTVTVVASHRNNRIG